jgi:hypothetical protein
MVGMSSLSAEQPTRQSGHNVHRQTVELSTREVTRLLVDGLGGNLVAFIVDRSEQTVRRWIDGNQDPGLAIERKLRDALQIFGLVREADKTHHVARSWFIGMNPQLDDVSPSEMLRDGHAREVLAAARAYVTGG